MPSSNRLQVLVGNSIVPPSPKHELLVAFRFGPSSDIEDHPAVVDTHLDPIGHNVLYECWWVANSVSYHTIRGIRIAECADYSVLIQESIAHTNDGFVGQTQSAYSDMFSALQTCTHTQIAKVWNYVGAINEGDGDEERYRKFSVGRAKAFSEFALADSDAPAATGIGTRAHRGLTTITLASSHAQFLLENPRQISAFQYPRQYGPISPKFARGASVVAGDHTLQLLSGTASIVGHESLHPYDSSLQLDETLKNIAALCETMPILDGGGIFRVYMRNVDDYESVRDKLISDFHFDRRQLVFLCGDICRRELLVELDGVRVT